MNKNKLLPAAALFASLMLSGTALAADAAKTAEPAKPAVAAAAKPDAKGDAAKGARKGGAQANASKLSPDKIKMYRDALQAAAAKNAPLQSQIQKMREELNGIIAADAFDSKAYIAKSAEIDKMNSQMRGNVAEATASALSKYTVAERKAVANLRNAKNAKKKGGGGGGAAKGEAPAGKAGKGGGGGKGGKGGNRAGKK